MNARRPLVSKSMSFENQRKQENTKKRFFVFTDTFTDAFTDAFTDTFTGTVYVVSES